MCDPTMILGAISLIGASKKAKPPPAAIPAAPVEDAKAETGADVVLGSDRDDPATATKNKTTKTNTKTTAGSGLKAGGQAGLRIL